MWGFPKIRAPFGDPYDKDYNLLESILGSPCFGKLPFGVVQDFSHQPQP